MYTPIFGSVWGENVQKRRKKQKQKTFTVKSHETKDNNTNNTTVCHRRAAPGHGISQKGDRFVFVQDISKISHELDLVLKIYLRQSTMYSG